jgi:enamine deaminase RidA (YjgF/YER057c/UK114 family)
MPVENPQGGYAYLPGLPFASAGVVALPGMSLVRAVLCEPCPLQLGYEAVERHLESVRRPLSALCGFEFRMPSVLSFADFTDFNARYRARLEAWGLVRAAPPPLARTNVVPLSPAAVAQDSLYAFSYSIEAREEPPAFVVSGAPELLPGAGFPANILRRGEHSAEALRDKTRLVVSNLRAVIAELGARWDAACSVHLYSRWPLESELRSSMYSELGISPAHGITCHDTDPPLVELALEIDVRRYQRELMLTVRH